ncbi:hypothetical protein COA01_16075 [Bacillus cereus]|uniref:hypothetical protein n=1 Tax=Bacillus cereus TaxID=1396 RepID=UPI000BFC709B|nr:hypothetical protein [Bacillus cereus]PGP21056.1 hypothetical protein COA01_16075 [Bacillus cereus]
MIEKNIYTLSKILTIVVLMFIFMKFLGFVFWVNHAPVDKWIALFGLFVIPTFVYIFLRNKEVKPSTFISITVLVVIIHVGWLLSSFSQQESYAFVDKNDINSTPYLVHENQSGFDVPSEYTLFAAINPYLFVKDSVHEETRGLVKSIQINGGAFRLSSNSVYIGTEGGSLFIR